jgi:hypothetical protein
VFVEDRIRGHYYEEPQHLTRFRNDLTRLRLQATKPEETAAYLHQPRRTCDRMRHEDAVATLATSGN